MYHFSLRGIVLCLSALWSFSTIAQIIPVVDGAMQANLTGIMNSSAGQARSRDVFIKVGDSITESDSFLTDLGCQDLTDPDTIADYGSWTSLIPITQAYSARTFPAGYTAVWCGVANSFTRASVVAEGGTTSDYAMQTTTDCAAPNNTYLTCEISLMNPTFALIMFGTNDVLGNVDNPLDASTSTYGTNMAAIVDTCIAQGVIPILSTIPPLLTVSGVPDGAPARVDSYNQVLVTLAASRNIPLWDFHQALMNLGAGDNYGISDDGIHPSAYQDGNASIFTSDALVYGYNVRNLNALQVLQVMQSALIEDIIFENGFE